VRQLIVDRAAPQEMRAVAISEGMRTMSHEAVALVAADVTTIDEVMHNVFVS
jgi:type II secretory ATPase GspE/PulE/Tfp pilus assembly ATPase PilB-like protein